MYELLPTFPSICGRLPFSTKPKYRPDQHRYLREETITIVQYTSTLKPLLHCIMFISHRHFNNNLPGTFSLYYCPWQTNVREVASKYLARPTSRCRRTESIVSLEGRVCSCAELQVFLCYKGWKEACQATRAISTTWGRELSSSLFLSCKARRRRKFTPFW